MTVDSLIDAARQPFLELAADIHGSLVYLDAGAAEVAELSLGPAFLLGLGALNVCSLEHAHPDDGLLPLLSLGGQPVQSLVVFLTQLLPDTHQELLNLLMVHPHVSSCQIFCGVSELAHAQLSTDVCDLGVEAYREYVGELRQALAGSRAAAGLPAPHEDLLRLCVRHLPLHIVALDTHTFVLPAAGAAASKAAVSGRPAGFTALDALAADADSNEGALGASTGLSLLPHALADLSRLLGAKLEPFAVGPASLAVAKELATLPQVGGRSSSHLMPGHDPNTDSPRAEHTGTLGAAAAAAAGGGGGGSSGQGGGGIGLVLVDRSLDLATPCMHTEHVLDLLFSCLEPAAGSAAPVVPPGSGGVALRPVDVRLDVSPLAPLHPLPPPPPPATPPLHQPQPAGAAQQADTRAGSSSDGSTGGSSSSDTGSAAAGAEAAAAAPGSGCQSAPHNNGSSSSSSSSSSSVLCPPLWPCGGTMGLGLFHPEDRRWLVWLRQLWGKPHKEALLLLRKWLKEALRAERITPGRSKLTALVSAAELRSLAGALMGQPGVFMRHQPIIALALAAAAAVDTGPAAAAAAAAGPALPATLWERLAGYERQLLLALPDGGQGREMLLALLLEAVQGAHPSQARLQLGGVLELLLVTYSLSGDRTPPATPLYSGDEAQIRDALADVILAHATEAAAAAGEQQQQQPEAQQALATLRQQLQCLPQVQRLIMQAVESGALSRDPEGVASALRSTLLEAWGRLRWLASARGKLRDGRRLMEVEADTGAACSTQPLLRQVLRKILLQADNRDLQQVESGSLMAGLLSKGLGGLGRLGFGGISAPVRRVRVDDFSTVLLFVVGGISPAEVRHLQAELDQHLYGYKPRVLIGGTTLLTPGEASRLFFA